MEGTACLTYSRLSGGVSLRALELTLAVHSCLANGRPPKLIVESRCVRAAQEHHSHVGHGYILMYEKTQPGAAAAAPPVAIPGLDDTDGGRVTLVRPAAGSWAGCSTTPLIK